MEQHYSMNPKYQKHVRMLEKKGMTTSDAQGVADIKFDPHFAKKKQSTSDGYMVKRSKFDIRDRHPGAPKLNFVPKRKDNLLDKKVPTHEQFRKDIERTANIDVYYKGKKRFSRGM